MVKKFKIVQNLERKYNGENLPIRVRQDDVGTIIESQILTEENNPYDLTNCDVVFNIQPPSGWPVLGEKATIIDPNNGKISYSLTAKDTKIPGRAKSACFTINHNDIGTSESTGDIDLIVLPIPKITDDDLQTSTINFKNKIRGDSSPRRAIHVGGILVQGKEPNTGRYMFDVDLWGAGAPTDLEAGQYFYDDHNFSRDSDELVWNHEPMFYLFKIKPNTLKIRINNMFPYKYTNHDDNNKVYDIGSNYPNIYNDDGSLSLDWRQNQYTRGYYDALHEINPDISLSGVTPLKTMDLQIRNTDGTSSTKKYVTSFEIDLRKNHFLTKDNELLLWIEPDYVVYSNYNLSIYPNIECVQYYLPDSPD